MIALWESDISATFLIFCLKCSIDAAFFKLLGKLFHKLCGPTVTEALFQIIIYIIYNNNIIGQVLSLDRVSLPSEFLTVVSRVTLKEKDLVDIPEQGHSWFYTSFKAI